MTRGKLLGNNNAFHFYFYINDDPGTPKNRRQNQFSEQTIYNRLNGKAVLTAVVLLSANNILPVSVNLLGKKNQVIISIDNIIDNTKGRMNMLLL